MLEGPQKQEIFLTLQWLVDIADMINAGEIRVMDDDVLIYFDRVAQIAFYDGLCNAAGTPCRFMLKGSSEDSLGVARDVFVESNKITPEN